MGSYLHDYNYNKSKMSNKHKKNKDTRSKELINKIKYNIKMHRLDSAMTFVQEYLSYNPNSYYVLCYKAMILYKQGKVDESIDLFEEILSKNDVSQRDRLFIMSQYANLLSTRDISLAIYYFEKAINESDNIELISRGRLSVLYSDIGRYDDAISILNIDGFNNMYLNVKRATVYEAKGDFNKALTALKKREYNDRYDIKEKLEDEYINQDKDYLCGHIYYRQGKLDMALDYLSRAINNKKRIVYFKANHDIIRILILKGRLDDAINLCEEVKKECNSDFFNRLFDELLAKSYAKKNDYKKAEEHYSNIDTDDKHKNVTLGKLELLKGNFIKAEEYLSCIDIKNDDINRQYDDFYRLALVKLKLKKFDEVLEILDIFFNNNESIEIANMKRELNRIKIYIENEQGKQIDTDMLSYASKQIVSYSEKSSLDHILDHHVYNYTKSRFNENIDVEKLFYDVKDLMTKNNVIYDSFLDKYVINYHDIGYNIKNEKVHQLLVLTLPNTKDIITMYPFDGTESIFTLEELEEKPKVKVKRLSQIEKFNKKYNTNI